MSMEPLTDETIRSDTKFTIGFFTFVVLILICGYFWMIFHDTSAYGAWCKVTGNVKDLTQDEWQCMTSRTKRMLIKKR